MVAAVYSLALKRLTQARLPAGEHRQIPRLAHQPERAMVESGPARVADPMPSGQRPRQ